VVRMGAGAASVAATVLAVGGTGGDDAGLASGLLNASQQVGSALGLAVLVSLVLGRTNGLLSTGADPSVAATGGFSLLFDAATGVLLAAGLVAFFVLRGRAAPRVADALPAGETR